MKIRWKLLILLLVIALVPVVVTRVIHGLAARKLGDHLASGTRQVLTENAKRHLQTLVEDYGRLGQRDVLALETALQAQAWEVERRLAGPAPSGRTLYSTRDFDRGENLPDDTTTSPKYAMIGADGTRRPMPISFRHHAHFLVSGVSRAAVEDDLARLSTLPAVYRTLRRGGEQLMHWQYTSLAKGVHTSYPGHGGYPADYDPRQRDWYRRAAATRGAIWTPPFPDVTTRRLTLTVCMAVQGPDGALAGVTGFDVPLNAIFGSWKLPEKWARCARTVLARAGQGQGDPDTLLVMAEPQDHTKRLDWRAAVDRPVLASEDADGLRALIADALAGKAGVREMPFEGRQALWAHAAAGRDKPIPLVIVPEDHILAEAVRAEQYVRDKTIRGLAVTGVILMVLVFLVVVLAFLAARAVSRPVANLTEAAAELAGGNYEARVDIRTGDELEALGEIFNDVGPKLREREKMKRSLEVAMHIQQHLLPKAPPQVAGFDIAGHADYCDETGGDYYDFIDLVQAGPGRLGIAVGDVTGHGIAAALLMASARAVLRSHAEAGQEDLGKLFETLNSQIERDTDDGRFITLFYGLLDAESRTLRWTSGGHDPALWLQRAGGRIEELGNMGVPLGVLEGAAFEQGGPVEIARGDVILIGTDGIWEAHNDGGEMFGKDRLRELLVSSADCSATEIHERILAAVHTHQADHPQEDDITLVVLKAE